MAAIEAHSRETIASAALVRIGEKTISDINAQNDRARTALALYAQAKQFLLSIHPWQFNLFLGFQLSRKSTSPNTRWTYEFYLPQDRLNDDMRALFSEAAVGARPMINGFAIQNSLLYTDETAIWCDYAQNKDESDWPPYFSELMITLLAAQFANPVTDQQATWDAMYKLLFDGNGAPTKIFALAMTADARASGTRVVQDSPFVTTRFAGGDGTWLG